MTTAFAQESPVDDPVAVVQKAVTDAIAKAESSVVAIARVRKREKKFDPTGVSIDPSSTDFIPQHFGAGVVVDPQGLILTTYHLLGDPEKFDYIVWLNRAPYEVTRIAAVQQVNAADPWTDLAILKIEAANLTPISFGDADALKKGTFVVALGNPHGIARDGKLSASWGIVSNLERKAPTSPPEFRTSEGKETLHHFGTLIQTDAKLPPGSSGGALINLQGEMVGLITSLTPRSEEPTAGGFAIPVDDLFHRVLGELKEGKSPAFGFLGVSTRELDANERRRGEFGARVDRVVENTPAARGGLRPMDVITHVEGKAVYTRDDLFRELSKLPPDAEPELAIQRDAFGAQRGREIFRVVTLSKKHIDSARPSFARQQPTPWRGLRIEYVTALPPGQFFQPQASIINRADAVGVLDVVRDSPAWKAGFRPGELITHVGKTAVATPRQFAEAVANRGDAVSLRVLDSNGEEQVRMLSP
ncbi:MAG: trypsin-like peptidase domain-containing protein [Planctomycetales bacterium]|nr:trypsin-like peptidase domain-containing protein [Planctomycetales bacterium]